MSALSWSIRVARSFATPSRGDCADNGREWSSSCGPWSFPPRPRRPATGPRPAPPFVHHPLQSRTDRIPPIGAGGGPHFGAWPGRSMATGRHNALPCRFRRSKPHRTVVASTGGPTPLFCAAGASDPRVERAGSAPRTRSCRLPTACGPHRNRRWAMTMPTGCRRQPVGVQSCGRSTSAGRPATGDAPGDGTHPADGKAKTGDLQDMNVVIDGRRTVRG